MFWLLNTKLLLFDICCGIKEYNASEWAVLWGGNITAATHRILFSYNSMPKCIISYLWHSFFSDTPVPTHRCGFEPALRSFAHFQGVILSRLEHDISQR